MISVADKVILTDKELEELEKKADSVLDYGQSMEMDIKKRLPYYKPTVQDFVSHNYPIAKILPYYIFLMRKGDDNRYRFEPDDPEMKATRSAIYKLYNSRIIVVENNKEAEKLASAIKLKSEDSDDLIV